MTAASTATQNVPVPGDVALPKSFEFTTSEGRKVKVRSLKTAGLLRLVTLLREIGIKPIPMGLPIDAFLSDDQRRQLALAESNGTKAQLLSDFLSNLDADSRALMDRQNAERFSAVAHWLLSSDKLAPALLAAVTNLSEAEVLDALTPAETFKVLEQAIDLVDVPALVQAALGFFSRIGGLTAEWAKQSKGTVPEPAAAA
jgi:hypothetical protein